MYLASEGRWRPCKDVGTSIQIGTAAVHHALRREAQRIAGGGIKQKEHWKDHLYPDELTTGLHFADVHKLTEILHRFSADGNTGDRDRAQPGCDQDGRLSSTSVRKAENGAGTVIAQGRRRSSENPGVLYRRYIDMVLKNSVEVPPMLYKELRK